MESFDKGFKIGDYLVSDEDPVPVVWKVVAIENSSLLSVVSLADNFTGVIYAEEAPKIRRATEKEIAQSVVYRMKR